jgi:hypothetical protein
LQKCLNTDGDYVRSSQHSCNATVATGTLLVKYPS